MTRDNAHWHKPERVGCEDPDELSQELQAARDHLAVAMRLLDDDERGDPNEAQEDIMSAATWIDHAAHITKGVSVVRDAGGDLRDPDDHDWKTGYVEVEL